MLETTRANFGLEGSLRNLDEHLLALVARIRQRTGREPGGDPFRGLYVEEDDVVEMLMHQEAAPTLARRLPDSPRLSQLGAIYDLSAEQLDVVSIALAPELDSKYERIYSYLQDDVTRKRPSIELVTTLLGDGPDRDVQWRARYGLLIQRGILSLSSDTIPLARRELSLHARIVAFLCGQDDIDPNLAPFCRITRPAAEADCSDIGLSRLARTAAADRSPLVLNFHGENELGKKRAALTLAGELNKLLLEFDVDHTARSGQDFETHLRDFAREMRLQNAVALVRGVDRLPEEERDLVVRLESLSRGFAIISTSKPWLGSGMKGAIALDFGIPEWPARRQSWRGALKKRDVRINAASLDHLAECFRFTEEQVEDSVEAAVHLANYDGQKVRGEHLFEAARSRSGHEMGTLARKVQGTHGWDDIVLPEDAVAKLREICCRVEFRHQVLGRWGFERKLSSGIGVNALFHGHSGTGKTMAAAIIAKELRLDLYKIDLAGIVSKYIGETEKNLDRIFEAAATANAILFFDEADALFGKRSEVRDSHDRYANLEISYLLQRMEQYDGVAILATNLKQNLDDAFVRRLAFSINFPFPDEASRKRIWSGIWPKDLPLALDFDCNWLASQFMLSGGHIRNAALGAAFLAAEHKGPVAMTHVLQAVCAEFEKMGKVLTARDLELPMAVAIGATA